MPFSVTSETNVPQVLDQVTAAFEREDNERVRTLLVGELAETGDGRLLGFFTNLLGDPNESIAHWAEVGLRQIDTKEARRVFFDHSRRKDDT